MLAHLWRNLAQVDYAGPIVDSCVCDIHLPGETWLEGHIGIMAVDGCGEVDSLSLSIFVVSKMAAVVVPRVPKYYIGCTNAPPIYSTPCVCVSAGAAHLDYATSVLFQTRALRSPSCATRAPLFFFFLFLSI